MKWTDLVQEEALQFLRVDQVRRNEYMKEHTSFKIGGPCDLYFIPESISEIVAIYNLCRKHKVEIFILGKGSNLLITDKGIRGAVIQLAKNFSQVRFEKVDEKNYRIFAQAGISLASLAAQAWKHSLGGMEFASGIPGTLGGAVFMNAGAYGGEMKDIVTRVVGMDQQGKLLEFTPEELNFSYRHSILQERKIIALEIELLLSVEDQEEIRNKMLELNGKRKEKQPLEMPSAGSTFKRPDGFFAGKLIMDSGLSGFQIGDAMVSPKHCGFVVNKGNASADEVLRLIEHIQKTVEEQFQVRLECEVKLIGER
ncbi:MAG: UDP-N-acetylmuramate dehydrogenase [Vallitaleaceae bacterium]|nr:UDP-N-acetylmuramate dehydrogenase [Vallitaleaceae bacterium]